MASTSGRGAARSRHSAIREDRPPWQRGLVRIGSRCPRRPARRARRRGAIGALWRGRRRAFARLSHRLQRRRELLELLCKARRGWRLYPRRWSCRGRIGRRIQPAVEQRRQIVRYRRRGCLKGRQAHEGQSFRPLLRRLGNGRLGFRIAGGGRSLLDARARRGQDLVDRLTRPCWLRGGGRGLRNRRCGHVLGRSLGRPLRYRLPGGCRELLGAQLRAGLLQRADRLLEGHAVRLEQPRRRALAVAHDRRQHDGPVDLPAARLLRGLAGGFQHPQQLLVGRRLGPRFRPHVLRQAPQVIGHVGAEAIEVDLAGPQHCGGFRVLGEGKQQMLQQQRLMRLLAREVLRPPQGAAEIGRHRNRHELVRDRLRHRRFPLTQPRSWITRSPALAAHRAEHAGARADTPGAICPLPHKPVREQGSIRRIPKWR
jgi:hypothetical protein